MIKEVKTVVITTEDNGVIKAEEKFQPLDKSVVSIPTSFKVNGSWLVNHECCNCNEHLAFGLKTDGLRSWEYSFQQMKYLCSKNYDFSVLEKFHEAIIQSEIRILDGKKYLCLTGHFQEAFPVTSSLQPYVYTCPKCKYVYYAICTIGSGLSQGKDHTEGFYDELFINQIICTDQPLIAT